MKTLYQSYQSTKAPELYGDYWFNSEPISIRSLQGEMVMLFFWDSISVSSQKMLELIKDWHSRYAELGLYFIGVHISEFEFAKKPQKIEAAIKKHSIAFPFVADNDRLISNAYKISSAPSIVLIDASGNIYDVVAQNFSVMRLERSMQYLLRQAGFFGELPQLQSFEGEEALHEYVPEIYTGYLHGALGNPEGYSPELPAHYEDPMMYTSGKFYAHGIWRAEKNGFLYEGKPNEGYLICQSTGDNIDALIGSDQKKSIRVYVDDSPVPVSNMGSEIRRDSKGNTFLSVSEPQLFSIFRHTDDSNHFIKMIPSSSGMSFYMFSFEKQREQDLLNEAVRNN